MEVGRNGALNIANYSESIKTDAKSRVSAAMSDYQSKGAEGVNTPEPNTLAGNKTLKTFQQSRTQMYDTKTKIREAVLDGVHTKELKALEKAANGNVNIINDINYLRVIDSKLADIQKAAGDDPLLMEAYRANDAVLKDFIKVFNENLQHSKSPNLGTKKQIMSLGEKVTTLWFDHCSDAGNERLNAAILNPAKDFILGLDDLDADTPTAGFIERLNLGRDTKATHTFQEEAKFYTGAQNLVNDVRLKAENPKAKDFNDVVKNGADGDLSKIGGKATDALHLYGQGNSGVINTGPITGDIINIHMAQGSTPEDAADLVRRFKDKTPGLDTHQPLTPEEKIKFPVVKPINFNESSEPEVFSYEPFKPINLGTTMEQIPPIATGQDSTSQAQFNVDTGRSMYTPNRFEASSSDGSGSGSGSGSGLNFKIPRAKLNPESLYPPDLSKSTFNNFNDVVSDLYERDIDPDRAMLDVPVKTKKEELEAPPSLVEIYDIGLKEVDVNEMKEKLVRLVNNFNVVLKKELDKTLDKDLGVMDPNLFGPGYKSELNPSNSEKMAKKIDTLKDIFDGLKELHLQLNPKDGKVKIRVEDGLRNEADAPAKFAVEALIAEQAKKLDNYKRGIYEAKNKPDVARGFAFGLNDTQTHILNTENKKAKGEDN